MAEIVLLPVDAPVVSEAPETPSAAPETPDDAIPAKRGRGRPPGARNKPKPTPIEPVETKKRDRQLPHRKSQKRRRTHQLLPL